MISDVSDIPMMLKLDVIEKKGESIHPSSYIDASQPHHGEKTAQQQGWCPIHTQQPRLVLANPVLVKRNVN